MLRSRPLDAFSGLLAFAVAASLSEFVAAALSVTSPYVAVGDGVIRLAPAAAVQFNAAFPSGFTTMTGVTLTRR